MPDDLDPQAELTDLIDAADETLQDLVTDYEVYEASYVAATASTEVLPEASNTSGMPPALIVAASSAR